MATVYAFPGYVVAGSDMRSPAERAQDEQDEREKEEHLNWECDPTFCIYCQLAREEGELSNGG